MAVVQHICFNICDKKMKSFSREGTDSLKSKQTQLVSSAYGSVTVFQARRVELWV